MKYTCDICGYIYDEEKEGVKFEELPKDWSCPLCGVPKTSFSPVAEGLKTSPISESCSIENS